MSGSTKICVEDLTTWGNAHEKKAAKLEGKTGRSVTSLMVLLPLFAQGPGYRGQGLAPVTTLPRVNQGA